MQKLIFIFLALWAVSGISQNKQILYGFGDVPQSLLLNPGTKVPQMKHYGIPFLSQIHFNGGASGVSVYDIFGNSSVDINTRIRNKIFEMKSTDFFTATEQLHLIDFGWKSQKEIYFSGGIYQEFDFITYFPRDLAILAWEGNRDYLGYEFNLGELSTTGDFLTVYHFGINKQISKKLTVGARLKLYSSMFSFRSVNNAGTFVTEIVEGSENVYEHTVTGVDITVNTSGYASLRDLDGSSEVVKEVIGRAFFGGNIGVGVDIGGTYDISENWTASASVLDFGAIFHSKDVESYRASGNYTLNGIELIFPPLSAGDPTLPYYGNLEDEIEREIPIDTLNEGYTQLRPTKLNGSLKYGFGKAVGRSGECDCLNMGGGDSKDQALGLHVYGMFRPKGPQFAGTLFYYRKLFDFLAAKATYTVDSYSYSNVGLGIAADIGKLNFYIAADNLLKYGNLAKAKSVSLQLGFNIKIDEE